MKIITLNTWAGRAGKQKLLDFFQHNKDADIFCLQEIWSAPHEDIEGHNAGGKPIDNNQIMVYGLQEISKILHNHKTYFSPHYKDNYGLMLSINNALDIEKQGELFVYKNKGYIPEAGIDLGNHARNIQYVTVSNYGKKITIINFHGLWNGRGKTDTEDRIRQSQNIIDFLKTIEGEVVFCGDFNLLPDTQSIKIFEDFGLRNLIKEYSITDTRTSLYNKDVRYADYIFVSSGITVKDFKVLPDVVSDHSPLYIEIE